MDGVSLYRALLQKGEAKDLFKPAELTEMQALYKSRLKQLKECLEAHRALVAIPDVAAEAEGRSWQCLASSWKAMGRYKEALTCNGEAMRLARGASVVKQRIELLLLQNKKCGLESKPLEASNYFLQAAALCKSIQLAHPSMVDETAEMHKKGIALKKGKEHAAAIEKFEWLLSYAQDIFTSEITSNIYRHLGDCYQALGKLDKAAECYKRHLSICQDEKKWKDCAFCLLSLGEIRFLQGEHAQSEKLFTAALAYACNGREDPLLLAIIYCKIADSHRQNANYEEVKNYCLLADEQVKKAGKEPLIAIDLMMIKARLAVVEKRPKEALAHLAICMKAFAKANNSSGLFAAYLEVVTCNVLLKNEEHSARYWNKAVALSEQLDFRQVKRVICEAAGSLAKLGAPLKAAELLTELLHLYEKADTWKELDTLESRELFLYIDFWRVAICCQSCYIAVGDPDGALEIGNYARSVTTAFMVAPKAPEPSSYFSSPVTTKELLEVAARENRFYFLQTKHEAKLYTWTLTPAGEVKFRSGEFSQTLVEALADRSRLLDIVAKLERGSISGPEQELLNSTANAILSPLMAETRGGGECRYICDPSFFSVVKELLSYYPIAGKIFFTSSLSKNPEDHRTQVFEKKSQSA